MLSEFGSYLDAAEHQLEKISGIRLILDKQLPLVLEQYLKGYPYHAAAKEVHKAMQADHAKAIEYDAKEARRRLKL